MAVDSFAAAVVVLVAYYGYGEVSAYEIIVNHNTKPVY